MRLNRLRRAMALALLALTGGLSVGVPLLDSREAFEAPGIEAQHDASRCSYLHDHDLCVVFQQTPAEAAAASPPKLPAAARRRGTAPRSLHVATTQSVAWHAARAPPIRL